MGKLLAIICLGLGFLLVGNTSGINFGKVSQKALSPAIDDTQILEGFRFLQNQKEPILIGDGNVLSGEKLAQFLIKAQIPVVWGSEDICGGSCSRLFCDQQERCDYNDGRPGIDPIYLNPAIQNHQVGMDKRLAGELAHEILHRMRLFGSGRVSVFEEFSAFSAGTQLSHASWPVFQGVDPKDPQQLKNWFMANGLAGYLDLPMYPGMTVPTKLNDTEVTFTPEKME
jgi:hypothetical protein